MKLFKSESKGYVLFLAPALLLFSILFTYPAISTFVYAFTNWNGFSPRFKFIGLANFQHLLTDQTFITGLKNTILLMIVLMVIQNVSAIVLSLALDRTARFNNILRAVYFTPVMLSPFVTTYIWQFIFSPLNGPVNLLLNVISGFPRDFPWLMTPSTALWCAAAVQLWISLGFATAIYLAGLQSIPPELLEAGEIDGVNRLQSFRHIIFPLLAPAFTVNIMLCLIGGLKQFDVVYGLTRGGPGDSSETIITVLVENIKAQDAGYGSAIGVVLLILIVILSAIQLNLLRRREVEM